MARYLYVTFCYHGLETKTCLSSALVSETLTREKANVGHGGAEAIQTDQMKEIFGLGGVAGFVSDLKRVSAERDEVVEKQSDCPMESAGAHAICHDGFLGHDLDRHLVHRYLARGEVVGTCVSYVHQHSSLSEL